MLNRAFWILFLGSLVQNMFSYAYICNTLNMPNMKKKMQKICRNMQSCKQKYAKQCQNMQWKICIKYANICRISAEICTHKICCNMHLYACHWYANIWIVNALVCIICWYILWKLYAEICKKNMHKYAQVCKLYAIICIDHNYGS